MGTSIIWASLKVRIVSDLKICTIDGYMTDMLQTYPSNENDAEIIKISYRV